MIKHFSDIITYDVKFLIFVIIHSLFYVIADSVSLSGAGNELAMREFGDAISGLGISGANECSPEMNAHLEGSLATEASMIVLDTLELIVQVHLFLYC